VSRSVGHIVMPMADSYGGLYKGNLMRIEVRLRVGLYTGNLKRSEVFIPIYSDYFFL